jgi:hypothetical protein
MTTVTYGGSIKKYAQTTPSPDEASHFHGSQRYEPCHHTSFITKNADD